MERSRKRTRGDTGGEDNGETRPMLTVAEASRLLNVHSNTLRRWSRQGIIKAYRLGPRGERRFRREDVAALFVEEQTRPSRTNTRRPVEKLSRSLRLNHSP